MKELINLLLKQEKDIKFKVSDKYYFEIIWSQNWISDDMYSCVSLRTAKDAPDVYKHQSSEEN